MGFKPSSSARVEADEVFLLGIAHKRGALHLESVEPIADPFRVSRGEDRARRVFRQCMGSRQYDFVGTTHAVIRLVSSRVVELLHREGVTGWATFDVEVLSKRGMPIEGYHGLAITGICGSIDNSKSPRVWREPAVSGGNRYQAWLGLYPDLDSWDGSEVFGPPATGYVFVTERVKNLLERHKVTGVRFQKLTETERLVL